MKSQCLLSLLVLVAVLRQSTAVTSCYKCSTTIGIDGVETNSPTTDPGSCVSLSGKTAVANTGNEACATTFTTNGGVTTIARGPTMTTIDVTTKGCTRSSGVLTCTCITDKCNAEVMAAPLTYDCYECQGADYFDNGCGAKLNSASIFVRTVKGCSACYKNVVVQADRSIQYYRGCTRSVAIENTCDGEDATKTCGCKGALCNSAETVSIKSVTAFSAVLLSAVFKLMC